MQSADWLILDTETTGTTAPIFVVDIAAQRMRGWESVGEPFRRLLNHDKNIPPEASRVHGYTREILERDGEPPQQVYSEFGDYVGGLPVTSYNLEFDWDRVLVPEWRRLGISPIGSRGLCALRLAQRLLDPVPAGNCKLQTLRQYYRMEERGAHTALGDVMTVMDLFRHVLRPIAEERGLTTWEAITGYADEEWYPSRIAFGKQKGKSVWSARTDREFLAWLESLAQSSTARTARMGRWYLRNLNVEEPGMLFSMPGTVSRETPEPQPTLVILKNLELERLRVLIEEARGRLAELEASFTIEKAKVDGVQASLFQRLRQHYQKRDVLRLVLEYRRRFLDVLLREGEEEAGHVEQEYRQAKEHCEQEYEEVAGTLSQKKQPTPAEEAELVKLWKKLVKLYHPDRFANEPDKLETYSQLTAAINRAKDTGDLETLRQIANDPQGFILRQGWRNLDFADDEQVAQLRKLWESLELEILSVLEASNQLRESAEFELYQLVTKKPELLDQIAKKQSQSLESEIAKLKSEAEELAGEIEALTGQRPAMEAEAKP